jgi:hypothetical protein
MEKTHRPKTMSANEKPAWVGLFPDQDFEFRFGARPGDAIAFFADTAANTTLMEGRRTALDKSPAQCLFEEPSAAQAVVECSDWAELDGGGCRELALHWEPDFLILLPDENGRFVFRAGAVCFPSSWRPEEKNGLPFMPSILWCPRSTKTSARALINFSPTSSRARRGSVPTGA